MLRSSKVKDSLGLSAKLLAAFYIPFIDLYTLGVRGRQLGQGSNVKKIQYLAIS